jgi:NAD(P)H-hydrate epimerase
MSPSTSPEAGSFPPGPQSRATIREWDRRAIEEYGIPGIVLMENAGAGAARIIRGLIPTDDAFRGRWSVLCGPGNNGGDGFVVARHLHNAGIDVRVILTTPEAYRRGSDAARNLEILRRMASVPLEARPGPPSNRIRDSLGTGPVVDALFGTGLSRPLESPFTDWVDALVASGSRVVALDIPSGLDADSGEVLGAAVKADHTTTFAAAKVGFQKGEGPTRCGRVHVVEIGMPRELWAGL